MIEKIMKSDDARQNWRELMDDTFLGGRIIIERYAKPLAVLMNYKHYQEMKDRLNMLEAWAEAKQIEQAIDSGQSQVVTLEQHKARMKTKGATYDVGSNV